MSETDDEKRMKLRYAGVCRVCGAGLAARTEAIYERSSKTIRCLDCGPAEPPPRAETRAEQASQPSGVEPIDVGIPGASARREYKRRQADRESRVREKHPKLGGLILAMSNDPQSTTAWNTGALGEERLGEKLNGLSSQRVRVLHDRRVPGTRANIDHIAVTTSGVFVIDAKRYLGKRPTLRIEGGLVRPRVEKLLVGGRDQTKLVEGVLKQVAVVRSIVSDDVPVSGALCFVESDWPLIGGAFTIRGVEVLRPRRLYSWLTAENPHLWDIDQLHKKLAAALGTA